MEIVFLPKDFAEDTMRRRKLVPHYFSEQPSFGGCFRHFLSSFCSSITKKIENYGDVWTWELTVKNVFTQRVTALVLRITSVAFSPYDFQIRAVLPLLKNRGRTNHGSSGPKFDEDRPNVR
jgi:hypothetical protein